ncbi:hypothetical protein INT48_000366, partial [Thamnidium elegans]
IWRDLKSNIAPRHRNKKDAPGKLLEHLWTVENRNDLIGGMFRMMKEVSFSSDNNSDQLDPYMFTEAETGETPDEQLLREQRELRSFQVWNDRRRLLLRSLGSWDLSHTLAHVLELIIIMVRNRLQSISNWYVAKVLFFFEIDLELPESRSCGSFYAVVEVMKSHKTSPYSKCIPLVHPFPANETKKYAVIDVGDILSVVGLIQKTDLVNNQAQSSNWFYVISPSTAFDRDMSINTGKISDLL